MKGKLKKLPVTMLLGVMGSMEFHVTLFLKAVNVLFKETIRLAG